MDRRTGPGRIDMGLQKRCDRPDAARISVHDHISSARMATRAWSDKGGLDEKHTADCPTGSFACHRSYCLGNSLHGFYGMELLGIGPLVRDRHRRHRGLWKARALGCSGCTGSPVAHRVCCVYRSRLALSNLRDKATIRELLPLHDEGIGAVRLSGMSGMDHLLDTAPRDVDASKHAGP